MTTIPSTMRASVRVDKQTIEMQERPVPSPAPDEVLVQVCSVGVCGSDVHYYRDGRIGAFVVREPLVLGHEVSGIVVDVGADVSDTRIGERVAIEPQRPCRRCRHCKTGRYNLCEQLTFYATPPVDGAFCDYVVAPADFAHLVPDALSDLRCSAPRALLRWPMGVREGWHRARFESVGHRRRSDRRPGMPGRPHLRRQRGGRDRPRRLA